ncbi:hypothetical protein VPNG_01886 [Cytospora leucostoma]|uniref:beta-N-acetylhexosaminidase n=1 Tax=Cytospora leucostoma TaxID=1230097 RepID=A0A423XIJ2_9PEZI|nr:hypothetical protein VPNG_01886 [Cytospora leucostoma]
MASRLLMSLLLLAVDHVTAQGLGGLWPVPQPTFTSGTTPLFVSKNIAVTYNGASLSSRADDYEPTAFTSSQVTAAGISRALDNIFNTNFVPWILVPRNSLSAYEPPLNASTTLLSTLDIALTGGNATFDATAFDVDESYKLSISEDGAAKLSANSTFGILHGLETFSQLFYEHSTGNAWYLVNAPIEIEDSPVHGHRGLLLDTARHWFPVADIKRTIDGLSYSKLNKLHVHVTDSQSWPLEVPSIPELSAKGAYSPSSVYSPKDIESIQKYGVARGVEVYFEIDMPGHIGVVGEAFPDLVTAYDAHPYYFYCAQPPCGQLRLNDSAVETFLGELFDDVLPRVARYSQHWSTGGDELNANSSTLDPGLQTNKSEVLQPLLQTFIDNQHTRVRNAGLIPTVWEELITQWNISLGSDVIVQSWLGGGAVGEITAKGHKVIDSDYNYWYLDCGRGQWQLFDNDIASSFAPFSDWCSPTKSWELNRSQVTAAPRLNALQQRLVARGIGASPIQMEWCLQYPNATGLLSVSLYTILSSLTHRQHPAILPSPLRTLLPTLSPSQRSELLYPPDCFPGARDVPTPYGSVRCYEFGPEGGRKVLLIHGISTSCMTLTHVARGLAARGCRVLLYDLLGRGYSDGVGDLPYDGRLFVSQALLVLASSPLASLVLLAPAGMIREENFGAAARFVFRSGWVPDGIVERLTRWRLRRPIAESARRKSKSKSPSPGRAAAAAVGDKDNHKSPATTTTAPGNSAAAGEVAVASEVADVPVPDRTSPNPLQQRVLRHVNWQVANHAGFVPAFMSTLRHAPMTAQHEAWGRLAARGPGTTLLVLGEGDPVIRDDEYRQDVLPLVGGEGHVCWARPVPGAHDFPMTHPEEALERIWKFWGWEEDVGRSWLKA